MVDLIYYYPTSYGAPGRVARSLLTAMIEKNNLFEIGIFAQTNNEVHYLRKKYNDIPIISIRDLFNSTKKIPVHFPVSPFLFPNRKFLLYFISKIKHNTIIMNYHGEVRSEFKIGMGHNNFRALFSLPDYFAMPYILNTANAVVLNSKVMKKLFNSPYNSTNIRIIPNGIDASWFIPEDKYYYLEEKKDISIFYHGRLSPEKGIDILLKAFHNVLKDYGYIKQSVMLYIAGDGSQEKYLKKLVVDLNIKENVTFLGCIPHRDLKSYLQSVDACIYPSIYEPFSLSILEAFSTVNGPVMYSDKSGINDFVEQDGYKFYVFEPTLEGTSNTIRCIIDKTYDSTIQDQQKEFASRYTWDKVAQQYIELYSEFLELR